MIKVHENITVDSPFSEELFHEAEMKEQECSYEQEYQWAFHSNLGSLTVLDRRTGFRWRDTETGFRDEDGKFWLASGMIDVRKSGCKTVGEAIEWVKKEANNCIPKELS